MMKTFNHNLQFLLLLIIVVVTSCYPDSTDRNSDYDLIISAFDTEFGFDTTNTFVLPDTLIMLKDSAAEDLVEMSEEQKQAFIEAVRDNLLNYNWIDLSETTNKPETIVLVSAVVAKYSDNIWDEWKWYEELSNVSPIGRNTRYSWYPNDFPNIHDFNKGSFLITMLDASNKDVPLVWIGSLEGIVTSKEVSTSKVVKAIDKIFELSPYLNNN